MERRFLDLAWRSARGVPLAIVAIGVLLTIVAVVIQRSSAEREVERRFAADVDAIEAAIERGITDQVERFRSSVHHIEATHPGRPSEFDAFFERESPATTATDPGVMLVEVVDPESLPGIEARERALRGEEFTIFDFSLDVEEKLIITRASNDIMLFGSELEGMDVTIFQDVIFPGGVPESGTAVRPVDARQLFQLGGLEAGEMPVSDPTVVLVLARVGSEDGSFDGFLVDFVPVDELLAPVTETPNSTLAIEFAVASLPDPIANMSEGQPLGSRETSRSGTTSGLDWTVTVSTTDVYERDAVPIDHTNTLLLGVGLTTIASLMVLASNYLRNRLTDATSELEQVRTLASTDALTGLLNRKGMIDAARRHDVRQAACLYFVDLDGFKAVNDESGHDVGDVVLREVALRLMDIFRPDDLVCRLGGDEFVVFTEGVTTAARIRQASAEITAAIAQIDDRITSSVGVAVRPTGLGTDVKELLRSADTAMYEAKRSGGNGYTLARDAA